MSNDVIKLMQANIKKFRLEKKLTQDKLSELTGISCDYLSEIERGKYAPSLRRFVMIAHALDIEPYRFFKP